MGRDADKRKFVDVMVACYMKDVMVQDHFDTFASKDRMNVATLRLADFQDGLKQLDIRWSPLESEKFFNLIDEAFNSRPMNNLEPNQIDTAVNLEVGQTIA